MSNDPDSDLNPTEGWGAHKMGQAAYRDGASLSRNPYTRHSYNWTQWRIGYLTEMQVQEMRRKPNVRT